MEFGLIEYKGVEYKTVTLDGSIKGLDYGIMLIEDNIAQALMPRYPDNDFIYADSEAMHIDEMCYAFVPSEWFLLPEKEFIRKFNEKYD